MRWRAAGITLALLFGLAPPANAARTAGTCRCRCNSMCVAAQVHGRLCAPPGGASRVQLLVHGATYDSRYWTSRSATTVRAAAVGTAGRRWP